jgi:hypothetical protein
MKRVLLAFALPFASPARDASTLGCDDAYSIPTPLGTRALPGKVKAVTVSRSLVLHHCTA